MKKSALIAALVSAVLLCSLVVASAPGVAIAADASSPTIPAHRWVGYFVPDVPWKMANLTTVESKTYVKAHVSNYFQNVADNKPFSSSIAQNLVNHGSIPLLTLEFGCKEKGVLKQISSGKYDAFLKRYAKDMAAFPHEIWIRPLHEMNGGWDLWDGTANGNSPGDFLPAWKHVHQIFADAGATNVKFVWCPNIESIDCDDNLNNPANAISKYWPGDGYVDYIALDGYNFGNGGGIKWRSFSSLFGPAYREVSKLSNKPIFVAETSCATVGGGNKAAWIADMFKVIPTSFPRIVGIGWFDAKKERDWRVDSSSAALQAFRTGASGTAWLNKAPSKVSITSNKKRALRRKYLTLSGALTPKVSGRRIVVQVKRPGAKTWAAASTRRTATAKATWRYYYKPTARGTYHFRVVFAGDWNNRPTTSRTIAVAVR